MQDTCCRQIHTRADDQAPKACISPNKMEAYKLSHVLVQTRAWAEDGICSLDGVPSALDHSIHFESVDIDLLSPLAEPAGHSLCFGKLCEEGYKWMTDAGCATRTVFRPSLATSLQKGQPIDGVAIEVQTGAAAQAIRTIVQ